MRATRTASATRPPRTIRHTPGWIPVTIPSDFLKHRWPTLGGVVSRVLGEDLERYVLAWGVLEVGVVFLVWGAACGTLREPLMLQTSGGRLRFGVPAALYVDADLGRYVLAAGWFGRGLWDIVLAAGRYVARLHATPSAPHRPTRKVLDTWLSQR
jgi:hypothetical protein